MLWYLDIISLFLSLKSFNLVSRIAAAAPKQIAHEVPAVNTAVTPQTPPHVP